MNQTERSSTNCILLRAPAINYGTSQLPLQLMHAATPACLSLFPSGM